MEGFVKIDRKDVKAGDTVMTDKAREHIRVGSRYLIKYVDQDGDFWITDDANEDSVIGYNNKNVTFYRRKLPVRRRSNGH